jgi:tetraacyldisaccharide 4'-kinase
MLRLLLFPFSVLYDIVTSIRNNLYDRNLKPSATFDIPILGIGNLAVGGTGKTPMVEYLIHLLAATYRIATLSRGYGRTTKGFRMVTSSEDPSTVGDEPFQIFRKFGQSVKVAVGEERAFAIPHIIDQAPDTDVIILDDAFQHRKVRASFQILLTDFNRPFYDDFLLPGGRLRESRRGAARADAIVITKCPPDLKDEKKMDMEEKVRGYSMKPVFFAATRYGVPVGFAAGSNFTDRVVLVSGIASTHDLIFYTTRHFQVMRHFRFSDHHAYSSGDLRQICASAKKENAVVLTTEKDAVKLTMPVFASFTSDVPFFYLPIHLDFLKNGKEFDEMVLNVLTSRNAP